MSAPAPSVPAKRGRKRKTEVETKEKKRMKEEEKENLLNSSSSTPSTSGSSRESSNPADGVERRARKGKPVKLDEIQKTLDTCQCPKVLYKRFLSTQITEKLFLTRNVRQKRNLLRNKAVVRKCTGKKLSKTVSEIEKKTIKTDNDNIIFKINYSKINSWSSLSEPLNEKTSTSLVHSFVVFVDNNDEVTVQDNRISIVPSLGKSTNKDAVFCEKIIELSEKEQKNVKMIFLAITARRVSAKMPKEDRSRRTKAVNISDKQPSDLSYETLFRFGSKLMYDKTAKIDKLNDGIQHIILVDKAENPQYETIFGSEECGVEWMQNVEHLKFVDRANKQVENSHLPRIIMTTEVPRLMNKSYNSETDEQTNEPTPVESSKRVQSPEEFAARLRLSLERLSESEQSDVVGVHQNMSCPIRDVPFPTLEVFKTNFKSRFPCFRIKPAKKKDDELFYVHPNPKYFTENFVGPFESSCDFRHPNHRCIKKMRKFVKKPSKKKDTEKQEKEDNEFMGAERNRVPGSNEKKFGLDFYQTCSQQSVISYVYMNRINDLVPKIESERAEEMTPIVEKPESETVVSKGRKKKEGTRRHEFYPINNATMFSDCILFNSDRTRLVKVADKSKEMQVAELPVTEEQTKEFNEKLALAADYIRKKNWKKGRAGSIPKVVQKSSTPSEQPIRVGYDTDGRPIPTFFELFFPYGKTELYNVLLRFFYSEAGHRPGCFSAEWKSRIMTGFIEKHWCYVLDNGLDSLFMKQLQVLAITTNGWKRDHYDMPMQKLKELKKQWRLQKKTVPVQTSQ